ncbi:hypothetical protein KC345_g11793, partial [Hortaea werneckii]
NLTSATHDPSKVEPSATAPGGGVASPAATDAGATATEAPTATPMPSPSPSNQSITVTQDRKSGKTTIYKVSAPAGSAVQVEIAATGVSWLEVYKGENSQGEKLSFGNTKAGDNISFTLGSEGMYIKSGYSPATSITVNGQVITDGKTSSRLLLELDDGTSAPDGDASQNSGTDATQNNAADTESITTE